MLQTIDRSVSTALEVIHSKGLLSKAKQIEAHQKANRIIAGFEVFDEEQERRELDAMIASQRERIDAFNADRNSVRDKIGEANLIPLAVVPTTAWNALCRQAGLYRLTPDAHGLVNVNPGFFNDLPSADHKLNALARDDWPAMLERLFPNGASISQRSVLTATVVLPLPPADVAQTLARAATTGYTLHVAAVPEAISFKETMAELRARETARRKAEEARRLAAQRDPIIYVEEGSAAAIIAQFGDFPIEQKVVDAVIASDDIIPQKNVEISQSAYDRQYFDMIRTGVSFAQPQFSTLSQLYQNQFLGRQ